MRASEFNFDSIKLEIRFDFANSKTHINKFNSSIWKNAILFFHIFKLHIDVPRKLSERQIDRQSYMHAPCIVHCGVHKWWAHHPKFQNKHNEYVFESALKAMSLTFFLQTTTLKTFAHAIRACLALLKQDNLNTFLMCKYNKCYFCFGFKSKWSFFASFIYWIWFRYMRWPKNTIIPFFSSSLDYLHWK